MPDSMKAVLTITALLLMLAVGCSDRSTEPEEPTNPFATTQPTVHFKPESKREPEAEVDHEESELGARASEWYERGNRDIFDLEYKITDQDGVERQLSHYAGKPIALSFVFTSCSNPRMCPLITITMANLQRELTKAELTDQTQVLLMTYDPVYDTPVRMKKFAGDRGMRFDNGAFLRPDLDHYADILSELSIAVVPLSDGSFNHAMELILIDHEGGFVRDYRGGIWKNEDILADLQKLVAEQHAATGDSG